MHTEAAERKTPWQKLAKRYASLLFSIFFYTLLCSGCTQRRELRAENTASERGHGPVLVDMGATDALHRDQRQTEDQRLADQRTHADASASRDAGGQGDARAVMDSGGRQDASGGEDQSAVSDTGASADAGENVDAHLLDAAAPDETVNRQLLAALAAYLETPAPERQPFEALELAAEPLNRATAGEVESLLWEDHRQQLRARELDAHQRGEISAADTTMRYVCFTHGVRPEQGWSLYLSMHGGGGAPPAVNDQQWNNQQRLYDRTGRIQEGL